MKICIVNAMHRNTSVHVDAIVGMCEKVASSGTEVMYKDTKQGILDLNYLKYGYTRFLNSVQMIEAMFEAKKEGADAIIHD